jgi:hypothetical protein
MRKGPDDGGVQQAMPPCTAFFPSFRNRCMTHLTQRQREALIELLCLAVATNRRESPAQEAAMHRALQKIGWGDPVKPQAIFLATALREAREIIDDEKCVVTFLADRTAHFETKEDQEKAMNMLMMVTEIDGMEESEDTFITRVRVAFGE